MTPTVIGLNRITSFTPEGSDVVFKLRFLKNAERARIYDATIIPIQGDDGKVMLSIKSAERMMLLCTFAIVGFTNAKDEQGQMVSFASSKRSILDLPEMDLILQDLLDSIDYDLLLQIANEVQQRNNATEKQEKNLQSPSRN